MDWASPYGLEGKTAIVTGAASGIGRGTADLLAAAGARVIVADLDAAKAKDVAHAIGGEAFGIGVDISKEEAVVRMFAEIDERGAAADVLVNNAAIYFTVPFLELSAQQWQKVHDVNTLGTFLCTREALRRMCKTGRGGSIVNISSVNAIGACIFDNTHYGSSKGGVNAITKNVALEFADRGIRVNAIMPGSVATEGAAAMLERAVPTGGQFHEGNRIPLKRRGTPADIARAALFLASDMSSYITGEIIAVDGGFHIS